MMKIAPSEFPLSEDLLYLNHAAVAPWPRRTAEAVKRFAEENTVRGAYFYPQWLKTEKALRDSLAWLLNAPSSEDIALLKNTSEALSLVAYGIDWQPDDNIVSFCQEFPSNRIVWESLAEKGVELRLVDLSKTVDPESAIMERCDARTRLVSTSSVQYADGRAIDLAQIGAFCRDSGILFCVDAIQSLGALPFDVQQNLADFVMADGHKWLLGPEGLALFYCRAELREQLALNQYGWHMVDRPGDYDRTEWRPSPTATRFECGSPNMLGIHGLHASLSLIRELGMEEISRAVLDNSTLMMTLVDERPELELLSSRPSEERSGIVTFRASDVDQGQLHRRLMAQGVVCAQRGGGIRFSPHFYTPPRQIEHAFEIVDTTLNEMPSTN